MRTSHEGYCKAKVERKLISDIASDGKLNKFRHCCRLSALVHRSTSQMSMSMNIGGAFFALPRQNQKPSQCIRRTSRENFSQNVSFAFSVFLHMSSVNRVSGLRLNK